MISESQPLKRRPLKQQQRTAARRARRDIPPLLRRQHARAITRHVLQLLQLRPGQNVAAYLPMPVELDTRELLRALLRRGCKPYLPRIESFRHRRMRFIAVNSGPLRRNRMGILEPSGPRALGARWMNLILLPLVAFDDSGTRLGNGAGYYDRALAFRGHRRHWRGPRLIGLAFAAQRLDSIERDSYDIPLDGVITEQGLTLFTGAGAWKTLP